MEVPLWPAALNLAGAIAQRQGRLEEAIQLFEGALALKPEQVAAASNLGYSYLALGKHDKAITQFDQVLRLRPRHSGAWLGRAQALAASGMLQESLKAGHEAESSSPDSPRGTPVPFGGLLPGWNSPPRPWRRLGKSEGLSGTTAKGSSCWACRFSSTSSSRRHFRTWSELSNWAPEMARSCNRWAMGYLSSQPSHQGPAGLGGGDPDQP